MTGFFKINRHDPRTLSWWFMNREKIDMNPPYQRKGRLWSDSDKAYLIDSIINGFDVPKLYLADFQYRDSSLNRVRRPYAIIDGKQRFEAVFDFFDGRLTLNEDFSFREDPTLRLSSLSLRDIKSKYPSIASAFENASWDVMSVVSDNEDDINDLFVRLNRSKPLTGAEVRNALTGQVPEMIRVVSKHSFFEETIRFSVARAGDLNAATKIAMFEYNGRLLSTKKRDLDSFARLKSVDSDKLELSGRKVLETLDFMQEIFLPRDHLLSSSGIFPVYYWFIRSQGPDRYRFIRQFLVEFESSRTGNRDLQKNFGAEELDPVLNLFDTFSRSTNDQGSHQGRFEILSDRFERWLRES
jgi:hypothetical protein